MLQTEDELNINYIKYRGKCKQFCDEAIEKDPTLKLVRGHYYCPIWGEQQHWWTVREDGSIYDPTKLQFPSGGNGVYAEFDGHINCEYCHKSVKEEDAYFVYHHVYCSGECYYRDVM